MEKNKKIVNILSFILIIILVGIIGYLLGSMSSKEDNNKILSDEKDEIKEEEKNQITPVNYVPKCQEQTQSNLKVDIDETKYNDIIQYINEQQKVIVTLEIEGENSKIHKLTEQEKNIVLSEIKNSTYSITDSGLGGVNHYFLKISYEKNNIEYYVLFNYFVGMYSNDGNIYKILDKSIVNSSLSIEGCIYEFSNLSPTAISIFKNNF